MAFINTAGGAGGAAARPERPGVRLPAWLPPTLTLVTPPETTLTGVAVCLS